MKFLPIALAAVFAALTSSHGATIKYEFTGGSLVATTTGLPAGVTAGNFTLWSGANLFDGGGDGNALRIQHGDLISNATATALTSRLMSFTLTIPATYTVNLQSLTWALANNTTATNEFLNARFFTSIDGYDDVTNDTIGFFGKAADGTGSGTTISFANPALNNVTATNISAADFTGLTNTTITFYMPMIRNTSATTDLVDIDNVELSFVATAVPEPTTTLLGSLGLLFLLRRRRH